LAIEVYRHPVRGCWNRFTLTRCPVSWNAPASESCRSLHSSALQRKIRFHLTPALIPGGQGCDPGNHGDFTAAPGARTTLGARHAMQSYERLSGLPAGLLLISTRYGSRIACGPWPGDVEFSSVAHRGPRASSVLRNPRPDIRCTGEWRDTGQQYDDRIECPGSFTSTSASHGRYVRELKCRVASESIDMNDSGHWMLVHKVWVNGDRYEF
jgi:hypothetical protein